MNDDQQSQVPIPENQKIMPASGSASATAATLPEIFDQIVEKIIRQQEAIIGPVAVEQAKQVHELKINWPQHDAHIEGNPQHAINELIEQYKTLFGQIAVQVSKEAVASMLAKLPPEQRPSSLQ
jgi:hypothetical protein